MRIDEKEKNRGKKIAKREDKREVSKAKESSSSTPPPILRRRKRKAVHRIPERANSFVYI